MDFLSGVKILEERSSKFNKNIKVVKSLGFGTYIQVDNLTQSGGVVYEVWRSTLRKVKSQKLKVTSCLILGLGGGSAAKLVKKYWPEAKITGVDIDPVMVELGKKYLGMPEVNIVLGDAGKIPNQKFDLILIDTYLGDSYPEKFEKEGFIRLVKKHLNKSGVAVFNRLYFREKRAGAVKFGGKLEKIFPKVEYFYPEANLMFICHK